MTSSTLITHQSMVPVRFLDRREYETQGVAVRCFGLQVRVAPLQEVVLAGRAEKNIVPYWAGVTPLFAHWAAVAVGGPHSARDHRDPESCRRGYSPGAGTSSWTFA